MERPFCAPMMAVSRSVVGTTLAPPFAPGRRPSPARPATPTYLLVTTLDGPFSSLIAEVCPLPPAAWVSPSVRRRRLKCSPSHDDTSAASALAGRCATVAPPQDAAPFVVAHAALLVFRRRALPLSPDHHASRLRTRRRRRQDVRPLLVPPALLPPPFLRPAAARASPLHRARRPELVRRRLGFGRLPLVLPELVQPRRGLQARVLARARHQVRGPSALPLVLRVKRGWSRRPPCEAGERCPAFPSLSLTPPAMALPPALASPASASSTPLPSSPLLSLRRCVSSALRSLPLTACVSNPSSEPFRERVPVRPCPSRGIQSLRLRLPPYD
jgi:hypothetical protein